MGIRFSPGPCGCCNDYAMAIQAGGVSPIGPTRLTLFINSLQVTGDLDVQAYWGQPISSDDHEYLYYFLATTTEAKPRTVFPAIGPDTDIYQQSSFNNASWSTNFKNALKTHDVNHIDFFSTTVPTIEQPLAFQIVLCTIIKVGDDWIRDQDILEQGSAFKYPPTFDFMLP